MPPPRGRTPPPSKAAAPLPRTRRTSATHVEAPIPPARRKSAAPKGRPSSAPPPRTARKGSRAPASPLLTAEKPPPPPPTLAERTSALLAAKAALLADLGLEALKSRLNAFGAAPARHPLALRPQSAKTRGRTPAQIDQESWRAVAAFFTAHGEDAGSLARSACGSQETILLAALRHRGEGAGASRAESAMRLLELYQQRKGAPPSEDEEGEAPLVALAGGALGARLPGVCSEGACFHAATHGAPGGVAVVCKAHAATVSGSVDLVHALCEAGCGALAVFCDDAGGAPRQCGGHAPPAWTNVLDRLGCGNEGCSKRSTYALPGFPRRFCATHALPGMVDVVHKLCEYEGGCAKHAAYGAPGGAPKRWCVSHAGPEDVGRAVAVRRDPKEAGSESEASVGDAGLSSGSDEGWEADTGPRIPCRGVQGCGPEGCGVRAGYAAPRSVAPEFCRTHKRRGMVRIYLTAPPKLPGPEDGRRKRRRGSSAPLPPHRGAGRRGVL